MVSNEFKGPGLLPIMVEGGSGGWGEGDLDLGGEEDRGRASAVGTGSWTAIVFAGLLCEGVWEVEERCEAVGVPAGIRSVQVPAHRTERIEAGGSYWQARLESTYEGYG